VSSLRARHISDQRKRLQATPSAKDELHHYRVADSALGSTSFCSAMYRSIHVFLQIIGSNFPNRRSQRRESGLKTALLQIRYVATYDPSLFEWRRANASE